MKKSTSIGLIIAASFLSVGVALAHEETIAISGSADMNAQTAVQGAGVDVQGSVNASANANANANAGSNTQGNATSSARNQGQQRDTVKNADKPARATSSENKPAWGQKGGLVSFLRGIFGLSSSSSVAEVKTSIEATTTATSTAKGLGFWARFMGFLGIK